MQSFSKKRLCHFFEGLKKIPPSRAGFFILLCRWDDHTILRLLHQLDDSHLSGIAAAGADADNAGVAAVTLGILGAQLLEQLLGHILDVYKRQHPGRSDAVYLRPGPH